MKVKVCTKCNIEKEVSEFSKHSGHPDGYNSQCKDCIKLIKREEYKKNKETIKNKSSKYYYEHTEERKAYQKQYRLENLEKNKLRKQKYADEHKEQIAQYQKEYRLANKEKRNKQLKARYSTDINYKLRVNLRTRIYSVLKGIYKSERTLKLLGCSIEELKKHLEAQFKSGMTWDNCGLEGWEIDHIKPCASFDLSTLKEQKICFHYTNLQPLWAEVNRSKADKILN